MALMYLFRINGMRMTMLELDLNTANINKLIDDVGISIGQFVVLVGLKGFTSVVIKTAVGNPDLWNSPAPKGYIGGQARHSWKLKHASPDGSVPTSWSMTMPSPPKLVPMGYTPLYLTSSVPYMQKLEDGHSTQGSHMMKRTLAELEFEFNSIGN